MFVTKVKTAQKYSIVFQKIPQLCLLIFIILTFSCKTIQIECLDDDNDGVPNVVDKCINEPGTIETYGCPDSDQDGIVDSEDPCPNTSGLFGGCPDSDGDGVQDSMDACPDVAGLVENNGCPGMNPIVLDNIGELVLPPPNPTTFEVLDRQLFQGVTDMEGVDKKIRSALLENGYIANKYLFVENGFALITQLEQIDAEGNSVPEENRWVTDVYRSKEFSIREFFKLLLTAQPGRYRAFVFIITKDHFRYSREDTLRDDIANLYNEGSPVLPSELGELPFTGNHKVFLNVYEFIKPEHEDVVEFNINSAIKNQHIKKSNIVESLKTN